MLNKFVTTTTTSHRCYQLLDEEGFLIDPYKWSAAFTEARAVERGLILTEKHWQLIELIRYKYLTLGAVPPMRSVCRAIGFKKYELIKQFGSCLDLWKLAGLPNPGEEAKTYMS